MLPVVSPVLESRSFVQVSLVCRMLIIDRAGQHGARTTDPLRQVDEGTKEPLASLINNHTTKYEVTRGSAYRSYTTDQWGDFKIH